VSKAGDKLLKAAKEAVTVAKCDHSEKIQQPPLTRKSVLDRFYCPKCGATLHEPRPSWRT